jgi:hypothetical protein
VGGVTAGDLNSDMQSNTGPKTFYESPIFLSSETKINESGWYKHQALASAFISKNVNRIYVVQILFVRWKHRHKQSSMYNT